MSEKEIIKIVIIGPESTGKSTLCQQLAAHYDTAMVPGICPGIFIKTWNELFL